MRCSSAPRVVSFRPAATTVTSVTSATPIVSAVAVVIVRPGWRIALRRASPPAAPPSACAGRPEQRRQRADGPRREPQAAGAGRRRRAAPRPAPRGSPARPAAGRRRAVTSVPTSSADDDRARGEHRARLGQREAHRVEQRRRAPSPAPSPANSPRTEASTPIASASTSTEPSTWRRRGADHPQQAQLTRALRDGDRERVEDRERADEDRHAAEHQQRDPDDRDELLQAVEREAVLLRGGHDLRPAAAPRRRPLRSCAAGDAVAPADEDRVDLVAATEQLAARRAGRRRPTVAVPSDLTRAEARDADDLVSRAPRRASRSARVEPTAVVLVLGGGGVDDDLARSGGPAAAVEPERRQPLGARRAGVEADAEVRAVAGRLAVALDDLGLVGDVGGGDGHPRDGADLRRAARASTVGRLRGPVASRRPRTRCGRRRRRRCRRRRRSTGSRRRRASCR